MGALLAPPVVNKVPKGNVISFGYNFSTSSDLPIVVVPGYRFSVMNLICNYVGWWSGKNRRHKINQDYGPVWLTHGERFPRGASFYRPAGYWGCSADWP